jgi:hypothetical protein
VKGNSLLNSIGKAVPALHWTLRHKDVGGNGGIVPVLLTSALRGCEWSASCSGPSTRWVGGWLDPQSRSGSYGQEKKMSTCRKLNTGRPARNPSLYRLTYPGSHCWILCVKYIYIYLNLMCIYLHILIMVPFIFKYIVLCRSVDGNNHKISSYSRAVTMHWSVNSNRRKLFSVRSVPRCYKQDKLVGELVSEIENCCSSVVVSCCCTELVAEAGDSSGKPGEGKRPPLEAAIK